nr:syntaxin-22 [Quercus suber]
MSFQDLEAGRPLSSRRDRVNGKQDSTQAVASGIFQINTAVSTFQRLVNTLGTPKDTPELREKLHKTRQHIGQLVKDTSAKLNQASEIDHHAEVNASKKIADAKLAKDFQAVLREFQKAQRLAAERETAYTPFVPQSVLPSSYTASEIDISSDKSPEQRALLVESRRDKILLSPLELMKTKDVSSLIIVEIPQAFHVVHMWQTLWIHSITLPQMKSINSIVEMTCLLLVIFGIVLLIVVIVLAA